MRFVELQQEKVSIVAKYVRSLKIIYQEVERIKNDVYSQLEVIKSNDILQEEMLICLLRELANNVYSGCEIINEMFISLYRSDERYRGCTLVNGFTSNFKKVYRYKVNSEKPKNKLYTDILLANFYLQAEEWYVVLHDIRTQETHYYIGKIYLKEGTPYYKTENRNGISKDLYTNQEREIEISVTNILNLIDAFLKTETRLCEIIIKGCNT